MIHHIVMFRLEGCGSDLKAAEFKTRIEQLPAIIDELDSVEVRFNDGPAAGNWTLVLHGVCADNASLEAYSAHPAHLECVAVIKPLIAARACVDYTD